jgi:two-component system CheB/CheR fusion protein
MPRADRPPPPELTPQSQQELDSLLEYLRLARGFDFSSYKPASLTRRLQKRMETLGITSFAAYQDHLEVHPDEFAHLFTTILINVTAFFRDDPPWTYLREKVVPDIVAHKGNGEPIRVWSAGCASGEEAYSLAILFAEALGPEGYRDRVKIYATDANEGALAKARQALYTEREVEGVPAELRTKYFKQTGSSYLVDTELRRGVVFGRHDLINDSPISRIDLLTCRNTLMYFNSETQAQILQRFHFALADGGYLMLGKAELMLAGGNLFAPVDLKQRVLRKVSRHWSAPRRTREDRAWSVPFDSARRPISVSPVPPESRREQASDMREAAMRTAQVAQVLIDAQGALIMANDHARALFTLDDADLGKPLSELTLFFRPLELRPHLQQAQSTRRAVFIPEVDWGDGPDRRVFGVNIAPLTAREGEAMGVSITFTDITEFHVFEHELRESHQALETAQEELQTTNEELQSTVEELETTNEELQSTNEELETMNEELQSTNEELRTSNDELRLRSDELEHVEGFWKAVIGGLPAGMIVLDEELRVRVWNARAEDLWGVRADEARAKHLFNLDIGLPMEELRAPIRECQRARKPFQVELAATNRKGRAIRVRVEGTPAALDRSGLKPAEDGTGGQRPGCLLLMQEISG